MTVEELKDIISVLPEARAVNTDAGYWDDAIPAALDFVIDEMLTAHDWDFATKEYTSEVSVADQGDYTIRGDGKQDCRDVVSVWYDESTNKLAKYLQDDMDDVLANDQAPSTVFGWTQSRVKDGYPIITLYSAPSDSGKQIRIRYLKKGLTIQDFPEGFRSVIGKGVAGWLFPSRVRSFNLALKKIIKRYRRGGKDLHQTAISPRATKTNNEIASLYGSG